MRLSLKRSLLNWGMLISCLVSCGILFRSLMGIFGRGEWEEDILSMSSAPLALSGYLHFACFFPVLAFSFSFLEELNSGYLKSILMRMSKKRYIRQKVFFTALSGGVCSVIPWVIIFGVICLIGQATDPAVEMRTFSDTAWQPYLYVWGGKFIFLCRLLIIFVFGCTWSCVGLMVSMLWPNRYVTALGPFIIYQLTWLAFDGPVLNWLNPMYLFRSERPVGTPLWLVLLVPVLVMLVMGVLDMLLMNRRLNQDRL